MMKKKIVTMLCISCLLTLSACGGQTTESIVNQAVTGAESKAMDVVGSNSLDEIKTGETTITEETTDQQAEGSENVTTEQKTAEQTLMIDPALEKSILEASEHNYTMPDEEVDKIWKFLREAGGTFINEDKGYGIYTVRHPECNYMIYLGDYWNGLRQGTGAWFSPFAGLVFSTTNWVNDIPTGYFEQIEEVRGTKKDGTKYREEITTSGTLKNGLYDGIVKTKTIGWDEKETVTGITYEETKYKEGIPEVIYGRKEEGQYVFWLTLESTQDEMAAGKYKEYDDAVNDPEYLLNHMSGGLLTSDTAEAHPMLTGIPGYADTTYPADDEEYDLTEGSKEYDEDRKAREAAAEENEEIISEMTEQIKQGDLSGVSINDFPFGTVQPKSMKYIPDGDPALYSVAFEYDDAGKLILGHYVNSKRGRNGTYRYNYEGNKLISRDFKWNDKGDYGQTVTYTYGDSGFVEYGLEHEEDAEEEMIWHTEIRYEYGSDGRLIKAVIEGYEDDGYEKLSTNGVYEFEY